MIVLYKYHKIILKISRPTFCLKRLYYYIYLYISFIIYFDIWPFNNISWTFDHHSRPQMPFLGFPFITYLLITAKQEEVHYANLTNTLFACAWQNCTCVVYSLIVFIYINHWHNNEMV